jgi:hypothetical protein
MAIIRYLAMAVPFFAVAGCVLVTGLVVAPHAFLGSITGNFEARAFSNMQPQSPTVTSLSPLLLGSKPGRRLAHGSVDVSDRNGDWMAVVDAVNMRSDASSAAPPY